MPDEIWVVKGRKPVLWTVPFYATWINDNEAHVLYAVPLMGKHALWVSKFMDIAATRHEGQWLISRGQLQVIAERVSGDPENYFSWERERVEKPKQVTFRRPDLDEFLDSFYQSGIGKSRGEVAFWWLSFCKHAQDWLINKEKPVNMYFVRLHNSPYRINWRHALLSRFPKLGRVACHLTRDRRDALLAQVGLDEVLMSPDLLAFKQNDRTCYRHVEVEHTRIWWKNVNLVEKERLRMLGPYAYCKRFTDRIRSRFRITLKLYFEWLCLISRRTARYEHSGPQGEPRFFQNPGRSDISFAFGKRPLHVPVVVHNKTPDWTPASEPENLCDPDVKMQYVSPVGRHAKNLRDSRRADVSQPRNGHG